MPNIDYLLIGHLTADIIKDGRLLGGTVSYAAPIAKLFGHRVGLVSSAAVGEDLLEPLLDVADVSIRVAHETTTFENIYTSEGRIQYVHGLAAPLTYDMIPVGWLDTPLVHLAPLVDEVEYIIASKFPDATVMLTPQGYLRRWGADKRVHFKRWLDKDLLSHVNILVFSKVDIADSPDLEAEFVQASEHVIVTDGKNGGIYYHNGEQIPYTPYLVQEVEPTGAGDVFAASLLASLLNVNHDMQAALKIAARLAAISVTRVGTRDTITTGEVQEALEAAQK